MKKILYLVFITFLVFTITGCGNRINKVNSIELYIGTDIMGESYIYNNGDIKYKSWTDEEIKEKESTYIVTDDLINYLNTLKYSNKSEKEEICEDKDCYYIYVIINNGKDLYVKEDIKSVRENIVTYVQSAFGEY